MSNTIASLLTRNLQEVFGEIDPARRRAAIQELWNRDGVFYDPKNSAFQGHDEIDRIAGEIKAPHPHFQYQPIALSEQWDANLEQILRDADVISKNRELKR